MGSPLPWNAAGLLFENCTCQILCPGHMSFRQNCTYERCVGHWSIHFEKGRYGEIPLGGLNAVIVFDSPQQMFAGGWVQGMYLDENAGADQRKALETILTGEAGGPWAVLARFVGRRLETRYVPIALEDDGRIKRVRIEGILESSVEALRGNDKEREVLLENLFNQIHAPTQVVARGSTTMNDGPLSMATEATHGLYSRFSWQGP
ncbi:MAG: DUF1326 domain-containing protein [Deltaproteobacteria bacterium]|nr:DUF1326 domain-containing protein [Deltaproteobacteria bacterium]